MVKTSRLTVVPTKSDSDVIFCLQLLNKTLTCTFHLSYRESIDHLIDPSDRINTHVVYRLYVPDDFVNKP